MVGMLELDEALKGLHKVFSLFPSVQSVFLFGSYGTECQTANSDIDFAVYFRPKPFLDEEADLLHKLSQLLDTDRVDLLNLNSAPLDLQFRAIATGTIVYERDYVTTCNYVERVINLYHDYAITLEKFYKDYDYSLRETYADGR